MKWIGLIGGMSWESTTAYYQLLNRQYREQLGGLHSAPVLMLSVDFAPLEQLMHAGKWDECGAYLAECGQRLEKAGADILLLCTNTMHRVAPAITKQVSIPFLHIADAVGKAITAAELKTVALLGTIPTMEADFYRTILTDKFGLDVLLPSETERLEIDRIIFTELCLGKILPSSKQFYLAVIERLAAAGAEGIILGCTEIGLLFSQADTEIPLFDTTAIHVNAALEYLNAADIGT